MDLAEAAGELAAAGIEGARFEAQLLLCMVLGVGRATVVAGTYAPLNAEQSTRFRFLVEQRARRVPMAYLRGTQEFYGREFIVSPAVLVPRPETELLVEQCLARLKAVGKAVRFVARACTVADVGTGTGCIPVSLLAELATVRAVAFDISLEALKVADQNRRLNGVADRLRLVQGDLLSATRSNCYDMVVSNPPYIPRDEIDLLEDEVSVYEPRLALDGGGDGLDPYRWLVVQARRGLRAGGWLCVEVGRGQAEAVATLMSRAGFVTVDRYRDFAGIERVVCGQTADYAGN